MSCACTEPIIPHHLYATIREENDQREDMAATTLAAELKAEPTFSKDLIDLKKSIRNTKAAQTVLFAMCRRKRADFIQETRPYVERIYDMQKKNIADIKKSPELKELKRCGLHTSQMLRRFEARYTRFSRMKFRLLRKLKMPNCYELSKLGKFTRYRLRRLFGTKPRLY